jgi:hypothetical protein
MDSTDVSTSSDSVKILGLQHFPRVSEGIDIIYVLEHLAYYN